MVKQETIADILAAMRDESHTGESSCLEWVGAKMRYYADRLEAAWKREKAKIVSKNGADFGQLGDAAKLREALKTVKRYFDGYTVNILELRRKVDAALAAPPRNCDVGTEWKQARRFLKYCVRQDCEKACPFRDYKNSYECAFAWAQMPYEEGGAHE